MREIGIRLLYRIMNVKISVHEILLVKKHQASTGVTRPSINPLATGGSASGQKYYKHSNVPRSPMLVVSSKYHCWDEKNQARMLLPIVEPMDSASNKPNKKTI